MGTLMSYLVGWFLTYRTIIWLQLILSIVCTVLILLVVESPVYLLKKNREEVSLNLLFIRYFLDDTDESKLDIEQSFVL